MTTKAMAAKQEKKEATDFLVSKWKDSIADGQTLVEVRTELGKGETDYVSVHVYSVDSYSGQITAHNLTPYIARAWGYTLRRSNTKFQIPMGGGQYSKSYDIALKFFQVLGLDHRETVINFTY